MSYETRQVLWVLLYLVQVIAAITAIIVFQQRAAAGRRLLIGGLSVIVVTGIFECVQAGYYLAAYYRDWDYNVVDDILPPFDLLIGGLLPVAGIFLIGAAVARAAQGIQPPKVWTYPSRYVGSSSPFIGTNPPPAAAAAFPPAPPMALAPPPPHPFGPGGANPAADTEHLH